MRTRYFARRPPLGLPWRLASPNTPAVWRHSFLIIFFSSSVDGKNREEKREREETRGKSRKGRNQQDEANGRMRARSRGVTGSFCVERQCIGRIYMQYSIHAARPGSGANYWADGRLWLLAADCLQYQLPASATIRPRACTTVSRCHRLSTAANFLQLLSRLAWFPLSLARPDERNFQSSV